MKCIIKKVFVYFWLLVGLFAMGGCAVLNEDPNEAQLPWAQPANWEGQVPGMPTRGGGY